MFARDSCTYLQEHQLHAATDLQWQLCCRLCAIPTTARGAVTKLQARRTRLEDKHRPAAAPTHLSFPRLHTCLRQVRSCSAMCVQLCIACALMKKSSAAATAKEMLPMMLGPPNPDPFSVSMYSRCSAYAAVHVMLQMPCNAMQCNAIPKHRLLHSKQRSVNILSV